MRKDVLWSTFLIFLAGICIGQQPAGKKRVHSESDVPRFTYPVKGKVSDLLQSDPASFNAFAAKVKADLQGILDNYEIEDKSTERNLLEDWLDPRRLQDDYVPTGFVPYGAKMYAVKGHKFGLDLSAEDKTALIVFLKDVLQIEE